MSKYARLGRHLEESGMESVRLSFAEIERILGFSLPGSARSYRAWWANEARGSHSHAKYGWMAGGYRVLSLRLEAEHVTFVKEDRGRRSHRLAPRDKGGLLTASAFEELGRKALETHFETEFQSRETSGVPKIFDYVSDDARLVGDAKYFSMVRGKGVPPAKFSTIAEHVWLLEHVDANTKFLLFGNDRRVPERWLERYGVLVSGVAFYFLDDEGRLLTLNGDDRGMERGEGE